MHVSSGTDTVRVTEQEGLASFVDSRLALDPAHNKRAKATKGPASLITGEIKFSSQCDGIDIVDNGLVDVVILVGRVKVLLILFRMITIGAELDTALQLKPALMVHGMGGGIILFRATLLPALVDGSISTSQDTITDDTAIKANHFLQRSRSHTMSIGMAHELLLTHVEVGPVSHRSVVG